MKSNTRLRKHPNDIAVIRMAVAFALLNFLLAACAGALLRLAFVTELDWMEFRNVLHAHSHLAILGWASMVLFSLLLMRFPAIHHGWRIYFWLFSLMEVAVIVMGVSFSISGYAFWSIASSSVFVVLVYVFAYFFLKGLRRSGKKGPAVVLIRMALFFLVFSTVILWAIGPVIAANLRFSRVFHLLIQAFLHFMINGWFVFAVLGLIFDLLREKSIFVNPVHFRRFYGFLVASAFLTYALAVAWSDPEWWVFSLNSTGVVLQCIALGFLAQTILPVWNHLRQRTSRLTLALLAFGLVSLVLKILIQTSVVLPFLATVAYTIRYFVIGFLHLILLGVVTTVVLAVLVHANLLNPKALLTRLGITIFTLGFLGTELILFTQGVMAWATLGFIPEYYLLIFLVTCLLPVGIALLCISFMRTHALS